jgi:xanthine dehydrogenase YagT iron-sulfur-binding subunit
MEHLRDLKLSRRELLIASAITATATAVPALASGDSASAAAAESTSGSNPPASPVMTPLHITINGKQQQLQVDTRTTLLDLLRENLQMTGTKKGCDHGQCGACTVIVDGRRINSCLTLAVMHEGSKVTTIEGLGTPNQLHPMQAAFVKHDGYQCGYCTPGQICSAVSVIEEIRQGLPSHVSPSLTEKPLLSVEEIRERMSGNICRCGAYSNIIEAITEVAGGKA